MPRPGTRFGYSPAHHRPQDGRHPYRGRHNRDHRGRYYAPNLFAYNTYLVPNYVGYPFGFDPFFDTGDYGQYDQEGQQGPQEQQLQEQQSEQQAENYSGETEEGYAAPPPPMEPGAAEPQVAENEQPAYRPEYHRAEAAVEVHPQPATTLVFNDGRPSEQVNSYVITATTLYGFEADTRREIPLSEIDVPATIEINRSAGVDFALPGVR